MCGAHRWSEIRGKPYRKEHGPLRVQCIVVQFECLDSLLSGCKEIKLSLEVARSSIQHAMYHVW